MPIQHHLITAGNGPSNFAQLVKRSSRGPLITNRKQTNERAIANNQPNFIGPERLISVDASMSAHHSGNRLLVLGGRKFSYNFRSSLKHRRRVGISQKAPRNKAQCRLPAILVRNWLALTCASFPRRTSGNGTRGRIGVTAPVFRHLLSGRPAQNQHKQS